MSWRRLEELGGIQWPCPSEDSLEPSYLHGRLWAADPAERGRLAPFSVVEHELPVDELTEEFPFRLTTGRRLDSYNTGDRPAGADAPGRQSDQSLSCASSGIRTSMCRLPADIILQDRHSTLPPYSGRGTACGSRFADDCGGTSGGVTTRRGVMLRRR
jgi:hypothetical protein